MESVAAAMSDPVLERCALCPRLCRSACPVASATGREAAAPTLIADVLLAWSRGQVGDALAREAATLCVDCGACAEHCHLGTPLPEALRAARARLTPAVAVEPLGPIEGAGTWVAVESDERAWSAALAGAVGRPVARWRTRDGLGAALLGRAAWADRAVAIADVLGAREAVVADGAAARALAAAGVRWRWLHAALGEEEVRLSCVSGAVGREGCCGGASPLAEHHPADAARMAARWSLHGERCVADSVCARALRAAGRPVDDVVDRLLRKEAP